MEPRSNITGGIMARYGTLGDYRFSDPEEAAADIRGAKVYGPGDIKLGEVDDVVFDETTGGIVFVVIDTGGWLLTKRFIVPPQEVRPSMQHEEGFRVDLTKQQIESFPTYDEAELTSEEQWADYERRYRSKWVENPVMHREATDRNITPTTMQQVHAGSGTISGSDDDTAELKAVELETEVAPVHSTAAMEVAPEGPELRWNAFEDMLRRRREEVLQSSIENAKAEDAKRISGGVSASQRRRRAS
jgi:sporulation protein YlmC with PRC-barrel domain